MVLSDQDRSGVLGKYVLLYWGNMYYYIWEICTTSVRKIPCPKCTVSWEYVFLYLFLYIAVPRKQLISLKKLHAIFLGQKLIFDHCFAII